VGLRRLQPNLFHAIDSRPVCVNRPTPVRHVIGKVAVYRLTSAIWRGARNAEPSRRDEPQQTPQEASSLKDQGADRPTKGAGGESN
jgi:hypothetical protein